ncbi:hypothetical protein ABT247_10060 [Kitasatospora sp. NPDC001539]|uniref:hypothetical protein n=1 Tax=Kitasatospora sp. NPDC001539 TaxID=3154384 RepID=UPI00331B7026
MSEQEQGVQGRKGNGGQVQGEHDRQGQDASGRAAGQESTDRRAAAAKSRLDFRDPFDQQSRDDTDAGWGERPGTGESGGRGLDWYLSQRPPHHGD